MALGVFILCGYFNITRVEFTCMATWLPYKTACVSIINVLVIDSLRYISIVYRAINNKPCVMGFSEKQQ